MPRKIALSLVTSLLVSLGALGVAPLADAATTTQLVLSGGAAFAVLGYDCGGISEHVYATGFAANGYPTGAAYLSTTCNGSGRGGHSFKVTAWASATWTWYGETRSYGKLAEAPAGLSTSFSEADSHGDRVYNTASAAYLETTSPPVVAPEAPTGVSAYAFRTGEEGESGPQEFSVGWTSAPETARLVTSSTVYARPVGSSAPTLTTTISGAGSSALLGTLEPNTTYLVTVTSTDSEGTSSESSPPYEAKSISPEAFELVPPIAITEPASGVAQTAATLEGYVNPAGEEVGACQFEYGTTEEYGTTVACSSLPGEAETPVAVSAPVAGLAANTTYHYRLFAASPGGTSYGGDQSFTTPPVGEAPTVKKLSPKSGPAAGGTLVTITGTGFTGATAVMFESAEAHIVAVNSNTSITVEAPPGTVGATVNVTVTTTDGTSAVASKAHFKYKKK
jgi:hypothetical protein